MEDRKHLKVKGAKPHPFPEHLDLFPLLRATEQWPLGIKMLLREVFLWWEFVRYDFSTTLFPGLAFALAAWKTAPVPMTL